jgi:FPC/CPF motif-containing protein YcgG
MVNDAGTVAHEWRDRVIAGGVLGSAPLPAWAERSYHCLHEQVANDGYPCFFGVQAERRGEMFYTFVSRQEPNLLTESMTTFAGLAQQPLYEKHNIAVFFEPEAVLLTHAQYRELFWRRLQSLHDTDTHPRAAHLADPADCDWEFTYQGVEMFVVCACPTFRRRRSRNLGPGMVMLFQPRSVFIDKITNNAISRRARLEVRRRLQDWDDVDPHPDLGFYGDPLNREWKQYFLPDDNDATVGACPFRTRTTPRS